MKQTTLFCHDKKLNTHDGIEYYNDFYQSQGQVRMCGSGKIVTVIARELKEGEVSPYWAWWDEADQDFCMIFPSEVQVKMCFPYGHKVEEDLGRGKLTNVFIEPAENA
jgi:hypothetical protein